MALTDTPRSNRLHIAFYGRRNAGKSSLINLVTGQPTALVSEYAGTTTDPVIKSMELLPLGPIAVIDTAGLDDVGELGALRIERSKTMMDRTDLALLVVASYNTDNLDLEKEWLRELRDSKTTVIGVLTLFGGPRHTLRRGIGGEKERPRTAPFCNSQKCADRL
mgnify:CR=1 FL=1